jgi:hypothetical protein
MPEMLQASARRHPLHESEKTHHQGRFEIHRVRKFPVAVAAIRDFFLAHEKISVDFCVGNSLAVTLVHGLAQFAHHFFLDFTFL